MKSPLISVVCPTYNRAKYLPTAIRCFLQQTYPNKEMILVDDGNEPTPLPIGANINYIKLNTKTATGTKRNMGAEAARGEIVVNWDDDDWSHAHRLEDQYQRLLRTGKAVTGYCATIRFEESSRILCTGVSHPPYFVSGTSQCYLRAWWDLHPFPDCSYGEDSVFSRTARLADELASANPGKMMVIRTHQGNTEAIDVRRYKRLMPSDISDEFFKAVDAPIKDLDYMRQPHICSFQCQLDMIQQSHSDVGTDYRITNWPEVQTR